MLISDYQILDEDAELGLELAKVKYPHAVREKTGINSLEI